MTIALCLNFIAVAMQNLERPSSVSTILTLVLYIKTILAGEKQQAR